jgi:apolipoprotein N-acyltransferase
MRLPSPTFLRFALAAVAGLLLSAAYPLPCLAGAAWVAPGLMLAAAMGCRRGEAFRLGYVAGLAHFLSSLYWLLYIPVNWLPIIGWLALGAFLALYPALWVWLSLAVPWGPVTPPRLPPADRPAVHRALRLAWPLYAAALWVATEFLRAWLLSGFPWDLLGVTQFRLLPLIQISAVTGVWGVSFLLCWTSAALLLAALAWLRAPTRRAAWLADLALPLVTVLAVFLIGNHRLARPRPTVGELRVACIQPSIPQTMIWDPDANTNRFAQLLALSRQALASKPDLALWPEAALPSLDLESFTALTNLLREYRVPLLFGADDVAPRPGATHPEDRDFFNAALLFNGDGGFESIYHKRKLVMFGEFVPLARWLPFLRYITPIEGGFTPGKGPAEFTLGNPRVRLCPLICFEDIFPGVVQRSLKPETDLLVNLTNNGWFGEGAAQWQHAATAIFRAIENGLPLLRSANNGLTCWVDPQGRIVQQFTDAHGSIYGAGIFTARIPLPAPADRDYTFYRRHGDWFPWACSLIALLGVLAGLASPPRRQGTWRGDALIHATEQNDAAMGGA